MFALLLAALTASMPATGLAAIRYDAAPPNFAIPASTGAHYLSDLRGKVVVIDFWATWCDVCTKEMRQFVRAQQTYGNRIVVVTVSNELHDVARSYFNVWNVDLPVVEDLDGAIERLYSIEKIPDTLVLDAAGRVTYVRVGGLNQQQLDGAIRAALQAGESGSSTLGRRVLP